MVEKLRELGHVKLVQVQPTGLRVAAPETATGSLYDATVRVEAERLYITSRGIEATTPAGENLLDIHHLDHPDKAYDNDDMICVGFTSHYEAMRARFGEHMVDGVAGENIIIEYEQEVWPEHLGKRIGFENSDTGRMALLDMQRFASPCREFGQFATRSQF